MKIYIKKDLLYALKMARYSEITNYVVSDLIHNIML